MYCKNPLHHCPNRSRWPCNYHAPLDAAARPPPDRPTRHAGAPVPERLRSLLHRAVDQQRDPRHAIGQTSGRGLRATRRDATLQTVRPTRAACGVRLAQAIGRDVRQRPRPGAALAEPAGRSDATDHHLAAPGRLVAHLQHYLKSPARSWRFARTSRSSGRTTKPGTAAISPRARLEHRRRTSLWPDSAAGQLSSRLPQKRVYPQHR